MSFEEGLRFGADAYTRGVEQRRQAALDQQRQQEWELRMRGLRREDQRATDLEAIDQEIGGQMYGAPSAGLPPSGGVQGAPSMPSMPGAPATGLPAPGTNNTGQRRDLNKLMGKRAARSGDMKGVSDAAAASRAMDLEDITSKVAKMSDDEIATLAQRTNTNHSQLPMILAERGKDGFTFVRTSPDGSPGEKIKLTPQQLRRVVQAQYLMESGFGTEGMAIAEGVDAKVAEVLKERNAQTTAMATTNNSAAAHQASAANGRISANASATTANAHAKLYGMQTTALEDERGRRSQAASLYAQFDALSPEEQDGPKGRGLMREFNMLNIKNGGQMPVQAPRGGAGVAGSLLKRAAEQKQNDDGSYTAFDKATGQPLYNTFHGEPLPLGMEVGEYKTLKQTAAQAGVQMVLGDDGSALSYRFVGPSGQPMKSVKEAAISKPAATAPAGQAAKAGGLRSPSAGPTTSAERLRGMYIPKPQEAQRPQMSLEEGLTYLNR